MNTYHRYDEQKITDFSEEYVSKMYENGYKFTRVSEGLMQSTKNLRVNLSKFELTSENRRVLRKNPYLTLTIFPLPYELYDWKISKMCKEFYLAKFNSKIFSFSKAKELFLGKLNMNGVLEYRISDETVGYCLIYYNSEIMHYCYPFYDLKFINSTLGIGMMTSAILHAKKLGLKFVYLGGLNSEKDNYKLQFKGCEWWDVSNHKWSVDKVA